MRAIIEGSTTRIEQLAQAQTFLRRASFHAYSQKNWDVMAILDHAEEAVRGELIMHRSVRHLKGIAKRSYLVERA